MHTPLTGLSKGRASNTPKGLNTVRGIIAQAEGRRKGIDPQEYAAQRWGSNSPAVEKAALPGMSTSDPTGIELVGSGTGFGDPELFQLVWASSIISKLDVVRVPFRTRLLNLDEGPVVAWRDEGGALRTNRIKATATDGFERYSLGGVTVVSNELMECNTVQAETIIRNQLVTAIAKQMDSDFISPSNSGSAGVKPASVTNAGSTMDSPSESLFDNDTFQGDWASAVILLHPLQAARLYGAARPDIGARGGSWAGFPVITSTAVPEGFGVFLDPRQVSLAADGVEVRVARETSIEMDSAPQGQSVTPNAASGLVSMFQSNSSGIMGICYANWQLMKPEACQVFDLQAYGLAGGM